LSFVGDKFFGGIILFGYFYGYGCGITVITRKNTLLVYCNIDFGWFMDLHRRLDYYGGEITVGAKWLHKSAGLYTAGKRL